MVVSETYNGPTGGHGEPRTGYTHTDYIVCDYCNKQIYTVEHSKIWTKRHIHLDNNKDICFTCAQKITPDLFTKNGWLKG